MKMHPSPGINSTFKIVPGCVALQRGSGAPSRRLEELVSF